MNTTESMPTNTNSPLQPHDEIHTAFVRLDIHSCTACWECIDTCPNKVMDQSFLYIGDTLMLSHVLMYEANACSGCLKCVESCRYNAFSLVE
jgi:ferredoxin